MSGRGTVGVLDSGVTGHAVQASRTFAPDAAGEIAVRSDGGADILGHGSALARIIAAAAPDAVLLNARIFIDSLSCTPAAVAAGLDWLIGEGAQIVNMSFGLHQDRAVLSEACARAVASGALILASAPARGPAVFPGSYQGVVRVSGDARCAPGEFSTLGGGQADFGAHVEPPDREGGGASFAVAHLTGAAALFLQQNPAADRESILEHLTSIARYHGPERRGDPRPEGSRICSN